MIGDNKKHLMLGVTQRSSKLIKLIVERVYIEEYYVVAMTLLADYHIVLGNKAKEPIPVEVGSRVYMCGSDGDRDLTCILLIPPYLRPDNHILSALVKQRPFLEYLSQRYNVISLKI